jgi:tetratricopeptide (TPR) repeat protein
MQLMIKGGFIMQYRKTQQKSLRAVVFASAATIAGLTAAGCSGISPGAAPATSGAVGASASVNAGHSDVTRVAALLQVGIQRANQKDWAGAATTFQDVLAINPGNVYALYNLGVIDQTLGKSAEAIGYYQMAIRVSAKYTPAMYNMAILLERPDPHQALNLYQQIVSINPQASTAYLRMAFVQAELGDHSAAQVSYAKAIAIEPSLGKYPLPAKAPAKTAAAPAATPTRS